MCWIYNHIECFHLFHQNADLCWTDVTPLISVNKLQLFTVGNPRDELQCHALCGFLLDDVGM